MRLRVLAASVAVLALAATGCSTKPSASASPGGTLRLGYFANVTHATALVEVERGTLAERLGPTRLETQVFNAGPAAVEAIFARAIDAAYLGPNPAINAYVKSKGDAVRIVAGATSGGAQLVVQPSIADAAGLRGKTLATPQLGNTQDVALRAWLESQGLHTDPQQGGDVTIAPSENATTLQLFKDHKIDGAWVPEPWASRLVLDGGAKVLVDEKDLWPGGKFVTTHLVVATPFLDKHPDVVKRLLQAHVETTAWITAHPTDAKTVVNAALEKLAGKPLAQPVLDRAFANLTVTDDPLAATLAESAAHATNAGLLKAPDLAGIYDLRILNQVLSATGRPAVADAGLGRN
ncbi:MAG TPA: ABC transporter substrate-binding protein [Mycobacteriales bacterium]|nr:ABC transporter substrate-binding protein [Mycobacteriales bacterium]